MNYAEEILNEREAWAETLRTRAEGVREHLTELWERIDIADSNRDIDSYEFDDPREELDELPLEIVWEKGEEFAVVLGTGGPHVEITGGGRNGGYRLSVYWTGTHTVTGEAITRTGEYFREMCEEGDL